MLFLSGKSSVQRLQTTFLQNIKKKLKIIIKTQIAKTMKTNISQNKKKKEKMQNKHK